MASRSRRQGPQLLQGALRRSSTCLGNYAPPRRSSTCLGNCALPASAQLAWETVRCPPQPNLPGKLCTARRSSTCLGNYAPPHRSSTCLGNYAPPHRSSTCLGNYAPPRGSSTCLGNGAPPAAAQLAWETVRCPPRPRPPQSLVLPGVRQSPFPTPTPSLIIGATFPSWPTGQTPRHASELARAQTQAIQGLPPPCPTAFPTAFPSAFHAGHPPRRISNSRSPSGVWRKRSRISRLAAHCCPSQ